MSELTIPGVPLVEQLLLQCLCGHQWVAHVPNLADWLGGPQVKCPSCNGHNDAPTFLKTVEDEAVSAIVPPTFVGLVEAAVDAVSHYDGSGDGTEPVPVTEAVDAADEVSNSG